MSAAPDPITLALLADRYRAASRIEAEAHARVVAAHDETVTAEAAQRTAVDATRAARIELLNYSVDGGQE